jgi:MFS family permease
MISYGTEQLGIAKSVMLNATLLAAVAEMVVIYIGGRIADRVGPWKVCAVGGVLSVLVAFPVFWLVDTGQTALVILGVTLGVAVISIPYATIGAVVTDLFPETFRYSAVAMSYNLSGVLGGFVPLVAAWLTGVTDGASWGVALLLVLIAACTAAGSFLAGPLLGSRSATTPENTSAPQKATA